MVDNLTPGLLHSPVDPRSAQYEAAFGFAGGGDARESRDWSGDMPAFRNQGWMPFCTAWMTRAIIHALNKTQDHREALVAPQWLFFKSGGGKNGNYMNRPAEVAIEQGAVGEEWMPYPNQNDYTYDQWGKLAQDSLAAPTAGLAEAPRNKLASYSFVGTGSVQAQIDALDHSPLGIAVPVLPGYFKAMDGFTPNPTAPWHALTVVKMKPDGSKLLFDTLQDRAGFDGFHWIPGNYPFSAIMSYRDLPDTWKEDQRTWLEKQFPSAYVQYGKQRLPLQAEQDFAFKLKKLVESYPDVGIRAIAARFWVVLVNACLYGGYSYTVKAPDGKDYFAWMSHGSDIANALYHYRRTGTFPATVDFNKPKQ